jgi:3-phosphoshikimate 1-carboxyvinyltransferase
MGAGDMRVTIMPGAIRGEIPAIPSKSQLHRLLICAALGQGETLIRGALTRAEDILATRRCLEALGAEIWEEGQNLILRPLLRERLPHDPLLDCGESGSTLRFLLPVVAALGTGGTFLMAGRLPERPMEDMEGQLTAHGCVLTRPAGNCLSVQGRLLPGAYRLPGNVSSQYITGLLLALPLLEGSSQLTVTGQVESEDYIEMTLRAQAAFGIHHDKRGESYGIAGGVQGVSPGTLQVEGDWSNGAFWLCAGAMPGGAVTCHGLLADSPQGDHRVLSCLASIGASLHWAEESITVEEVRRRETVIDAAAIPDLIPPLAAVAAVGEGVTRVINAGRLRMKESDRLRAVAETLNALGANVIEEPEGLLINGVSTLQGGTVDSWGDHRIAMMAAIASTACREPVTVENARAVFKSYPGFWEDLEALGKNIKKEERP